jgi:uncharacterized protein (DUF58 family)
MKGLKNVSIAFASRELASAVGTLELRARRVVEGSIAGGNTSPWHGVSVEFADHREYVPGDDLKRLDWRVFARSGRHFIKRFEEETNLSVMLAVDCSGSMAYEGKGRISKYTLAAQMAGAMALILHRQRDAAGLLLYGEGGRHIVPPSTRTSQPERLLDALESAKPDGITDAGGALALCGQKLSRPGLVILFSDLLTDLDAFHNGLRRLCHGGHEVWVVHIMDPDELELPFHGPTRFTGLEGEAFIDAEPDQFRLQYREAVAEFCEGVIKECRSQGASVDFITTRDDAATILRHALHRRANQGGRRS